MTLDNLVPYDEENNLLSTDSKFRSYASSMDKALKAFEGTGEWADLINSLVKIQKVLQTYSGKYTIIPRKTLVAKRLAQVLHPALPSGVHLKAIEIYQAIFAIIGVKGLGEDLFIYSAGLFPLMGSCSMSTKPKLLDLYEKYYIPLGNALSPAMPALLHGILPGLEEGSEYFYPTLRLLEMFRKLGYMFTAALWKCVLENSSTRFQALTLVAEVTSKSTPSSVSSTTAASNNSSCSSSRPSKEEQDSLFILDYDIMIYALCECLQDNSVLVQRMALDIVINVISQTCEQGPSNRSSVAQGASDIGHGSGSAAGLANGITGIKAFVAGGRVNRKHLVLLTCSALDVLLRKDLSLNRRLFSWLYGPRVSDKLANECVFLDSLAYFILMSEKVCAENSKIVNRAVMLRPLRVINTLVDSRSEMSSLLLAQDGKVLTTLFRFLLSTTQAMLDMSSEELYNRTLGFNAKDSTCNNNSSFTKSTDVYLDSRTTGDLIKSANLLFQEIHRNSPHDFVWKYFSHNFELCCARTRIRNTKETGASDKSKVGDNSEEFIVDFEVLSLTELCQFVSFYLDIISLESNDGTFERHIPDLLNRMTSLMCSYCDDLKLKNEIKDCLLLIIKLIEYVHPSACYVSCSNQHSNNIKSNYQRPNLEYLSPSHSTSSHSKNSSEETDDESICDQEFCASNETSGNSSSLSLDMKHQHELQVDTNTHRSKWGKKNFLSKKKKQAKKQQLLSLKHLEVDGENDLDNGRLVDDHSPVLSDSEAPGCHEMGARKKSNERSSIQDNLHASQESLLSTHSPTRKSFSIVEACVVAFKKFLDQLIWSKVFKPNFNNDTVACKKAIEQYCNHLLHQYSGMNQFQNQMYRQLDKGFGICSKTGSTVSRSCDYNDNEDVTLKKIEIDVKNGDSQYFVYTFDLTCKLLNAYCTLPVKKEEENKDGEGGKEGTNYKLVGTRVAVAPAAKNKDSGGRQTLLPDWLMSLFICGSFVSNFSIQAKSIDCILQQLALSTSPSQSLQHFYSSQDQVIIPSINSSQIQTIHNSYNLFLSISLSLWSWLDTKYSIYHEKAVDLWLQLHRCCPPKLSDLCEDVLVYCMQKSATSGGIESCRRFSTIWHLSRAINHVKNLITAGQPFFDKCVLVMLDGLTSAEVTRRTIVKQWLVHCILSDDVARLLEPLMLILFHQKTCRIVAQGFISTAFSSTHTSHPGLVSCNRGSRRIMVALMPKVRSAGKQGSGSRDRSFPCWVNEVDSNVGEQSPSSTLQQQQQHSGGGGGGVEGGGLDASNPFAFSFAAPSAQFMSEVEREMMIDSEDFEEVDSEALIKQLLSGILNRVVTHCETEKNAASTLSKTNSLNVAPNSTSSSDDDTNNIQTSSKDLSSNILESLSGAVIGSYSSKDELATKIISKGATGREEHNGDNAVNVDSIFINSDSPDLEGSSKIDQYRGGGGGSIDMINLTTRSQSFSPTFMFPNSSSGFNIVGSGGGAIGQSDGESEIVTQGVNANSNKKATSADNSSGVILTNLDDIFSNFFLLYKQMFDFQRSLHVFTLLSDILKVDPILFLNSICSTTIGCGNTPYVHQIPTFVARHKNSIMGKDFYTDVSPEHLAPYRNASYIELLITVSLFYLRSSFPFDMVTDSNKSDEQQQGGGGGVTAEASKQKVGEWNSAAAAAMLSDSDARTSNCHIQISATEFLIELFTALNHLVTSNVTAYNNSSTFSSINKSNICVFVNELLTRCKVQKTVLLCLLCHVKTDGFAYKTMHRAASSHLQPTGLPTSKSCAVSTDLVDTKSLELKLLDLISVLIKTEYFVFVNQDRQLAEKQDFLVVDTPFVHSSPQSATGTAKKTGVISGKEVSGAAVTSSAFSALLKYNVNELIVCQSFFVQTILDSLKQYDLLTLQSYWLKFTVSILPYTSKALKYIVVPTVNQVCRNLEILSDEKQLIKRRDSITFLPPDFIILLLDTLSSFFSFCTLGDKQPDESTGGNVKNFPSSHSGVDSPVADMNYSFSPPPLSPSFVKSFSSQQKENSAAPSISSTASPPPCQLPSNLKKEYWQDAKKGLLDILPRILSCLLCVWKTVEQKRGHKTYSKFSDLINSGDKKTAAAVRSNSGSDDYCSGGAYCEECFASTSVLGQPEIVREHLISFIQALALAHGSKLSAAVALVWNIHHDTKNRMRRLDEKFTEDQIVLVSLIKHVPSMDIEAIVASISQVLKLNSSMQLRKQPIMEISILQFFYAYIRTLDADFIEKNHKLILSIIRDSVQCTFHGGQVILLLVTNYVIDNIVLDQRDLRELQEVVLKVVDAVVQVAAQGLIQSAWIGKLYTVKQGVQVPSYDDDLLIMYGSTEKQIMKNIANIQPSSANAVQSLEVMSQILANLLDVIHRSEEKEKINSTLQSLTVILMAYLKSRNVDNIPSLRASTRLMSEFTFYHYTRKSWRRDMFELFLDKCFFQFTADMVPYWRLITDNLMTHDRMTFKEFLGQTSIVGMTAGLIKSREFDIELKAKLLKRLAFVLFSSEKDQYNRILPELQERVSDVLKLGAAPSGGGASSPGGSPAITEQVFLLFRIFLLRFNQDVLVSLWPIMISELTIQLKQLEFDLLIEAGKLGRLSINSNPSLTDSTTTGGGGLNYNTSSSQWDESVLTMYLSVAKFLDTALLLSSMSLSHFQTYVWAFVGVGIQPDDYFPSRPSQSRGVYAANANDLSAPKSSSNKRCSSSFVEKSCGANSQSSSFVPYCVKIAQLLEERCAAAQRQQQQLNSKPKLLQSNYGYPLLSYNVYSLTDISQLQPFFSTICHQQMQYPPAEIAYCSLSNRSASMSKQSCSKLENNLTDNGIQMAHDSSNSTTHLNSLRKKLVYLNNLPLTKANDATDFVEKLAERDFCELFT